MRLIDADALELYIEKEFDGVTCYDVAPSRAVADFQEMVCAQPTVDAHPVAHGKWEYIDFVSTNCSCSVCGGLAHFDGEYHSEKTPYCPHCEAKMDLGD